MVFEEAVGDEVSEICANVCGVDDAVCLSE